MRLLWRRLAGHLLDNDVIVINNAGIRGGRVCHAWFVNAPGQVGAVGLGIPGVGSMQGSRLPELSLVGSFGKDLGESIRPD